MQVSQAALISTAIAVVLAGVGAFLAGSERDPAIDRNMDAMGVATVTALTAPAPGSWRKRAGTFKDARQTIRGVYGDNFEWPSLGKETKDRIDRDDYKREQRNQKALERLGGKVSSLTNGVVRGLMLKFRGSKHGADQQIGALIKPQSFPSGREIPGTDVSAGLMTANDASGSFQARVYYRPYRNAAGSVVGGAYAILSASKMDAAGAAGSIWIYLTPLLVLLGCGLIILQANQAGQGARSLARDLDSIGRGRLDTRVAQTASGEVGLAQKQAERMGKNLQLITMTGSGDLDEALEKELDLAQQIHGSLRPNEPPRVPGYELETLFKGGREIGGDYFDYIELDERRIALVLADCSESLRGIPAAMVMAMTRAYLKTAIDPETGPAEWLKRTNRQLANDLKAGMAVTALIAVLDTEADEVIMASAGHRPAILWRSGKTATINPNGIALGLDIGPVFDKTIEEKRLTMHKSDRLVLYTDGLVSATNDSGDAYGEERFMESVRKQGAMNSAAFVNFVAGGMDKFLGGEEQDDDITISTLKRMK